MAGPQASEAAFLDGLLALRALTELERETWVDVHILGLRQKEIADRDGVSEPCVTQRLARAQRKLEQLGATEAVAA